MFGYIYPETKWEKARLGKITSSDVDKLFTAPRSAKDKAAGHLSGTAKNYIRSKAAEIITGTVRQFSTWAMDWGTAWEPVAAETLLQLYPGMEYFGRSNQLFVPYGDFAGGSPDGFDLSLKLVFEIKCPANPEIHVEYCLLESAADLKKCRRKYYHQLQMNMVVMADKHAIPFSEMKGIFCSYCPTVNSPFQNVKVLEVEPDMEFYHQLHVHLATAESLLADMIHTLSREYYGSTMIVHYDPTVNATVIEEESNYFTTKGFVCN